MTASCWSRLSTIKFDSTETCASCIVLPQAARGSVAREAAALEEQRAALASLLAQLEQREEALGQVCGGRKRGLR